MFLKYVFITMVSCILHVTAPETSHDQKLSEDLSTSGWTDKCITDDTSRHCYEIFDTKITWKKASDLCTYDGGTLAIIESFEQQTFIEDLMKKRRFNVSGLWIGSDKLHPEERRAWADGDYFSYVNWAPGEPNSMVNENCAELRTNNGTWNDVVCRKTNGVICDVKGRWLNLEDRLVAWDKALNICDGGTPMTLESPEKQILLFGIIQLENLTVEGIWLGSNKVHPERNRTWTDGNKFTYVNWAKGEPNNYVENCVEIDTHNKTWNDLECTLLRGYICEKTDLTKPFIKDDTSGHFYQVFDTKVTWKKASDLCKYDGGNLVTIESIEEQTFITDLIKKRTFTVPGLWIGSDKLHLDEQRAWANGEKMSYANWAPGEPNSHLIEENCLVIRTKDSTWMDVTCTERNGYICEISRVVRTYKQDENTGRWYKIVYNLVIWDDAFNICNKDGGTLMIIESSEEQRWIAGIIQDANLTVKGLWLGSNKVHPERSRTWTDRRKFTYVNWAEGEPNNTPYVENCAEMYTSNGTWNDRDCMILRGVICEKTPEVTPYKLPEVYIILISVGSALVSVVGVTILGCLLHKRNKSKKKQENYQDVHNLEMNQAEHEYDRANENYYTIYDN